MPELHPAAPRLRDFWFRIDLRSAGLFRILLGLILIWHWTDRWQFINLLYSADGVLPGRLLPELSSPLAWLSPLCWPLVDESPLLVRAFFLGALVCYVVFLVGYRTRLFAFLSLFAVASIAQRNPYCLIGADFVMGSLLLWAQFLPVGARFSLDAFRNAMNEQPRLRGKPWSGELSAPTVPLPRTSKLLIAAFGVVLNLGLIYLFTALHKTVPMLWGQSHTWRDGTAVWYMLHLEQSSFGFTQWCRELPLWCFQALTWGTLVIEFAALPMFLVRAGQPWTRRIILLLLIGLHTGIALTIDAGLFSYTMFAGFAVLLTAADWQALRNILARFSKPVTVYYDDSCGICTRTCQAVAVWDRFSRVTFIGSSDAASRRHDIPDGLIERTIVVFDEQGRMTIKAAGAAAIFRALPLPWHVFRLIALPGLKWISDAAYDAFARNRHRASGLLRMTACGIQPSRDRQGAESALSTTARASERLSSEKTTAVAEERLFDHAINWPAAVVLASVLASTWAENGQVLWNKLAAHATGESSAVRGGAFFDAAVSNPVIAWPAAIQRWDMFSPDPPSFDHWWVVDGTTADGRRIDPQARPQARGTRFFYQPRYSEHWYACTWGAYLKYGVSSPLPQRAEAAIKLQREYCRYLAEAYNSTTAPGRELVKLRLYNLQRLTPPPGYDTPVEFERTFRGIDHGEYDCADGRFTPACDIDHIQMAWWFAPTADDPREVAAPARLRSLERYSKLDPRHRRDGLARSWYPDGRPRDAGEFALDEPVGIWTEWDEDGGRSQGSYRDGQRQAAWTYFDPQGRLAEGPYEHGEQTGLWTRYFAPAELPLGHAGHGSPDPARAAIAERVQLVKGQRHGPAEYYYPDGTLRSHGKAEHDQQVGLWRDYYPSGRLKQLGGYEEGQQHGAWTFWHDAGDSGEFVYLEGEFRLGKMHGTWTEWNTFGDARTTVYEDGVRVR